MAGRPPSWGRGIGAIRHGHGRPIIATRYDPRNELFLDLDKKRMCVILDVDIHGMAPAVRSAFTVS